MLCNTKTVSTAILWTKILVGRYCCLFILIWVCFPLWFSFVFCLFLKSSNLYWTNKYCSAVLKFQTYKHNIEKYRRNMDFCIGTEKSLTFVDCSMSVSILKFVLWLSCTVRPKCSKQEHLRSSDQNSLNRSSECRIQDGTDNDSTKYECIEISEVLPWEDSEGWDKSFWVRVHARGF